jgi:predicted nuclease of predicted toxin-antitoxin system
VKLLFDQNLSHYLPPGLADVFPDSAHVREFGLQKADDQVVWDFARDRGFTIVSKDADFRQMSFLRGSPPKVVWLNVGNCSTARAEAVIRTHAIRMIAFDRDPDAAFLVIL